jgi:hypothetical protein
VKVKAGLSTAGFNYARQLEVNKSRNEKLEKVNGKINPGWPFWYKNDLSESCKRADRVAADLSEIVELTQSYVAPVTYQSIFAQCILAD